MYNTYIHNPRLLEFVDRSLDIYKVSNNNNNINEYH